MVACELSSLIRVNSFGPSWRIVSGRSNGSRSYIRPPAKWQGWQRDSRIGEMNALLGNLDGFLLYVFGTAGEGHAIGEADFRRGRARGSGARRYRHRFATRRSRQRCRRLVSFMGTLHCHEFHGLPDAYCRLSCATSGRATSTNPTASHLANSNNVISGRAPSRIGKPVVPMPRFM